jgi:hypothetical protein
VRAGALSLASGGTISAAASGSGNAGNLDVRVAGQLDIAGGAGIATSATTSDGGNIRLDAASAYMDSGHVTTAVGIGSGNGGNMEIRIPTLVMHNSVITANAFGGNGGNIHIATTALFKNPTSSITASSQLGVDGTISIDSPAIDPAGSLLPPQPSYFDAGAVLTGRCGARLAGRASSLVIVPRNAQADRMGDLLAELGSRPAACEPVPTF